MAHIRIGELLVKAGHLSVEALGRALDEQKRWGGRLGRILREMNLVTEQVLLTALSKQLGLPRADLRAPAIPNGILDQIDPGFAMQNRICPERYEDATRTLYVALEDHLNLPALDKIAAKTGARVKASLASNSEIAEGLARLYPSHPATMAKKAEHRDGVDAGRNMAMFETKDFSSAAAEMLRADEQQARETSLRYLETADFSEAAKQLQNEPSPPKKDRMKYFGTDDFSDAASKVRDED